MWNYLPAPFETMESSSAILGRSLESGGSNLSLSQAFLPEIRAHEVS